MNVVNENKKNKLIQEIGSGQRDNLEELKNSYGLSDKQQAQVDILQAIIKDRLINKSDKAFSDIN
ncbi:MAG: hypothetical protein OEL19_10010, partial [Sulfurimonas sp.]|nr:hypothetical protein [Sulfurimonas sp.]